jgi:spore coat protein CotH
MAGFWEVERLTPRSFFTVVYFDGVYQGLFMALDRIDNEFLEHQGFDPESSLYKAVHHDANFFLTDAGGDPKDTLHDGFEKKEGEPEDDYSDLDALVAFTGHADAAGLVHGASEHLDLAEFMDWFLLVHYCLGEDSAGKNAYLARTPKSSVFRYAPWDFNHAWGQDWRTLRASSSSRNFHTGYNRVFWAIQELEATDAELWERYRLMAQPGGPFDPDWLRATVDAYFELIEPSAVRDWERWGADYSSYSGWADDRDSEDDWQDYQGEKAYLYQWLDERAALFEDLR